MPFSRVFSNENGLYVAKMQMTNDTYGDWEKQPTPKLFSYCLISQFANSSNILIRERMAHSERKFYRHCFSDSYFTFLRMRSRMHVFYTCAIWTVKLNSNAQNRRWRTHQMICIIHVDALVSGAFAVWTRISSICHPALALLQRV